LEWQKGDDNDVVLLLAYSYFYLLFSLLVFPFLLSMLWYIAVISSARARVCVCVDVAI